MKNNIHLASEIDSYLKRLFPINRSLTGKGNRATLSILQEVCPLNIIEYPSGLSVYDWEVPKEWVIRDAWVKRTDGKKIIDFKDSNIHIVGYSGPISKIMSPQELEPHLHYHECLANAIPYRTNYYDNDWGFCVTKQQYDELTLGNESFEVFIDSEFLTTGNLTVGELLIPGKSNKEILISTYICHPSLGNDNLSGLVMTAFLARNMLKHKKLEKSYRIIWVPETIGAICYCAMNEEVMKRIKTGLVVTTVGGRGKYGYKQSFDNSHSVNEIIEQVFHNRSIEYLKYPFDIRGSDERQYSSQGFRINVATITKDKYYEYPYYHTSLDNLDFISANNIALSLELYYEVVMKLDSEPFFKAKQSNCELMLSKYDLYSKVGGGLLPVNNKMSELDVVLWLLWLCDGDTGIYQIKRKLILSEKQILRVAYKLINKGILEKVI